MDLNFTAIDFETANSKRGSVCQLGLTRVVDGKIIETKTSMVTPPEGFGAFHERNIAVHGILPHHVKGAPTWETAMNMIIDFSEGTPLVGHNVSFEKSVVKSACEATNLTSPQFVWACSLKMARKHLKGQESYSLGLLSAALGLEQFAHHDAGEDARASAQLVLYTAQKTGITDLHQLFG